MFNATLEKITQQRSANRLQGRSGVPSLRTLGLPPRSSEKKKGRSRERGGRPTYLHRSKKLESVAEIPEDSITTSPAGDSIAPAAATSPAEIAAHGIASCRPMLGAAADMIGEDSPARTPTSEKTGALADAAEGDAAEDDPSESNSKANQLEATPDEETTTAGGGSSSDDGARLLHVAKERDTGTEAATLPPRAPVGEDSSTRALSRSDTAGTSADAAEGVEEAAGGSEHIPATHFIQRNAGQEHPLREEEHAELPGSGNSDTSAGGRVTGRTIDDLGGVGVTAAATIMQPTARNKYGARCHASHQV